MKAYNSFRMLFPPRPDKAIPPDLMDHYENRGWWGQIKKNGTCTILAISPEGELHTLTRHNEPHKAWVPNQLTIDLLSPLARYGWIVFSAELLHNKTPTIKDTLYIHDILVYESEVLEGSTLLERSALLDKIFPDKKDVGNYFVMHEKLWLVKNLITNFKGVYDSLTDLEDEGLVLKNPKAILKDMVREGLNSYWQVKARRATKNYAY